MRRFSKRLLSSGIIDIVAGAIPGIRDILVLGKIKQIEQQRVADLVLVDAPATGHAMTFLSSAAGLLDAARGGPIRAQAADVVALLSDPARCQVALVTLPEEMPVNEVVEAAYQLEDKVGVALGPVIVNACYPPVPGLGGPGGRHRWPRPAWPSSRRARRRPLEAARRFRSTPPRAPGGAVAPAGRGAPAPPAAGALRVQPSRSGPAELDTLSAALAAGDRGAPRPRRGGPRDAPPGRDRRCPRRPSPRSSGTGRSSSAAGRAGWARPPPRPPSPSRRPGSAGRPAWSPSIRPGAWPTRWAWTT